ncbi:hypothetical protein [Jiella sp. M17.18]|uniref:hypothetical protein n=1 Tax=Jiella sp. M17.18 TaxID=3234247 RepID=UPI0034DEFE7A
MSIKIIPTSDPKRILISFPYDPDMVTKVKSIPGAKWDSERRAWSISTRYRSKVDELAAAGKEAGAAFNAALAKRADEIRGACPRLSIKIEYWASGCMICVSSYADLGALKEAVPSARWDSTRKCYKAEVSTMDRVDAVIEALREVEARSAALEDENRKRREAEQAKVEAAREAKERADREAGRGRISVLVRQAPAIGTVLRRGDSVVRITGHGKSFRLDENASSMGWPVGCEGELACYAYCENATVEERAALEAKEAAEADRRRIRIEREKAIATVAASDDMPTIGVEPAGEIIWSDDRNAAAGYRTWIVLTPDGWLWHLTYDGSDGATWGDRNAGYNTVGRRVPATDELIAAIRGQKRSDE